MLNTYIVGPGATVDFEMHNTLLLPDSGLLENYSNVSITDSVSVGDGYRVEWGR